MGMASGTTVRNRTERRRESDEKINWPASQPVMLWFQDHTYLHEKLLWGEGFKPTFVKTLHLNVVGISPVFFCRR